MVSKKIEELMCSGRLNEVIELLEELKTSSTVTLLDELELTILESMSQRRLRHYSRLNIYNEPIRKLHAKVEQKYSDIKDITNLYREFLENKITLDTFSECVNNLSLEIKERLPSILYLETRFLVNAQKNFFFPLTPTRLLSLFDLFQEYNGSIYYAELHLQATWSHLYKWENKIALDLAFEYLKEAQDNNDSYGKTISYFTLASIYADMGNFKKAIDYSLYHIKHAKELGITNILWRAYFGSALHYAYASDLSNALKYDKMCSELELHPNFSTRSINSRQMVAAHINLKKGEINLALKQMLEILEKSERFINDYYLSMAYGVIAEIYSQKNDYNLALDYYLKSLKTREEFGGFTIIANDYFHIFEIYLHLDQKEEALEFLEKLRKLNAVSDHILVKNLCSFSEALYLKSKNDEESRKKAKEILVDLITEVYPYYVIADRSYFHLCDLLLEEFKKTENMSLIDTLHNYIKELTLKATFANSNLLLIELYFLQSKILLLDLKVEEAINLLEQALALARDKGLKRLEILLSDEYDLLLQQIDAWEDFSSYLPTLDERLELTHIEDLLKRMMRKWVSYGAITPENESPQYLVIMNEEGTNIFTEVFPSSVFESEELAEAVNKIMHLKNKLGPNRELLRFRYHQYSCLLTEEQNLLLCYIFMGKSYIPMSKFRKLKEILGKTSLLQEVKETWIERRKIDIDSRIQISTLIEESFRSF